MAEDYSTRKMELAKELLEQLKITAALLGKYQNMPAQAEELLKEYKKYYGQAWDALTIR